MDPETQLSPRPFLFALAERLEQGLVAIESNLQLIRDGLPADPIEDKLDDNAGEQPPIPPVRGGRWI